MLLEQAHPGLRCETVEVSTRGDRNRDVPADEIPGGPGVFTKEVEEAVLDGRADAAVHSAKDLPTAVPPGLVIAAVPERVDPRDALVGSSLEGLPRHAVVATDSVRRRGQLLRLRPDLRFTLLRGNVDTRLSKLDAGEADALVLAMAGLIRLGADSRPDVHPVDTTHMVPAMGQGALAVEAREDDDEARALLAAVDVAAFSEAVAAERRAVAALGGGCESGAAALARDGRLLVAVTSSDGATSMRREGRLDEAEDLARALLDDGARRWLAS